MIQNLMSLDFPNIVKWYITGKCNLRCKHCYLTDYTKESSIEKVLPVIDYLASEGVRHIYFLGGEPLLRNDLEIILKRTQQNNINTMIATNGTLLTPSEARKLKDLNVGAIQISLDSPDLITHDHLRGKGNYLKTIQGIMNAKNAGLLVTLAFVANKANYLQIFDLISLSAKLEVDLLRIMPLIPIGTSSHYPTLKLDSEIIKVIQDQIRQGRIDFPKLKIMSGLEEHLAITPASPFGCGAGTTHLIINSDFTLSACDLGTELERTANPICNPEEIKKYWNEDPIFNSWRKKSASHCHLGKIEYPDLPYF